MKKLWVLLLISFLWGESLTAQSVAGEARDVEYIKQMNNSIMEYYSKVKESADIFKKKYQETGNQYYLDSYKESHQKLNAIFRGFLDSNFKQFLQCSSYGNTDGMNYTYGILNPATNVSFVLVPERSSGISYDVYSNGKKIRNLKEDDLYDFAKNY